VFTNSATAEAALGVEHPSAGKIYWKLDHRRRGLDNLLPHFLFRRRVYLVFSEIYLLRIVSNSSVCTASVLPLHCTALHCTALHCTALH
jgi:hypothetical protein